MNSQGKNAEQKNKYAAQRVRSKRIIAIVLGVSILFVASYFIVNAIINREPDAEQTRPIFFYEPDWDKDIMQDKKYLGLDRSIYFEDTRRNEKISLIDDNAADVSQDYRAAVELLRKYVKYAIAGDADKINQMFSDVYYAAGYESKDEFTMQQLYDICISTEELRGTEENGVTYQQYVLKLGYKIRENNGTFRNDVGSDGEKPEYFIITDRNGVLEIDAIITFTTK